VVLTKRTPFTFRLVRPARVHNENGFTVPVPMNGEVYTAYRRSTGQDIDRTVTCGERIARSTRDQDQDHD
jgi:hypothetical protein